jgi:UDP-N-acetylglucosamine--N-acetylmuramyl-(pentapeptide) pyrophosphoryl-undecaprenol N-acetylglucosamine transferase
VPSSPFQRVGWASKLAAARDTWRGAHRAQAILRSHRVRLVIGFGGYPTAGALLAARRLGLLTAIHEANAVPGLVNRLFARHVDRIYVSHPASAGTFPAAHVRVTGNPVREEIVALHAAPPEPPRAGARILVTGGSLGSEFLNREAPAMLAEVGRRLRPLEVWHQVGEHDPAPVRGAYERAGVAARVSDYIPDIATAYRFAHFVISNAGAVTLAELAATGLPSLQVPLAAAADDHQTANAMRFAQEGGGWWVAEREWDPDRLAIRLHALLCDPAAWLDAARRAHALATPAAARLIVADCEGLMRDRG